MMVEEPRAADDGACGMCGCVQRDAEGETHATGPSTPDTDRMSFGDGLTDQSVSTREEHSVEAAWAEYTGASSCVPLSPADGAWLRAKVEAAIRASVLKDAEVRDESFYLPFPCPNCQRMRVLVRPRPYRIWCEKCEIEGDALRLMIDMRGAEPRLPNGRTVEEDRAWAYEALAAQTAATNQALDTLGEAGHLLAVRRARIEALEVTLRGEIEWWSEVRARSYPVLASTVATTINRLAAALAATPDQ